MKYLTSFLIAFIFCFMMVGRTYAVQKYSVSFPVLELGNCASLSECRTYCEDPLNHTSCINFARKKGFYKEEGKAFKNAVLNYAKQELGCDSESTCQTFCGQQTNWEKCGDFANKHKVSGGQVEDPGKAEILSKAKEFLGCSSYDSCKGFCIKEENRQKCDDFAKFIGLRGGVEKRGPGGCTSLESCRKFCSDPVNYKLCSSYASSLGQKFIPPQATPTTQTTTTYQYQEYCYKTPGCTWKDNSCSCVTPSPYPSRSPYPSSAGTTSCQPPASGCEKYYYFDQTSCVCKSYADKCKSYGCSWTGVSCVCSTSGSSTYSSSPTPAPTLSTSTNTGTYSSVKGVSTVRSFLEKLLDYFQ